MGANFLTQSIQYGVAGLNLSKALDALTMVEKARWKNLVHTQGGSETIRPGYLEYGSIGAAARVHTIRRMNALVGVPSYARVYGADNSVYIGQGGNGALVANGFSGSPLTMVPHHSAHGGDTWMYIGDTTKNLKVRIDGLGLPIGLAKPVAVVTANGPAPEITTIEDFEAGFAAHAGTGNAPTLTYPAGKNNNCLNMATVVGAAIGAYWSYADKALNLNLNTVGTVPATDDDIIHIFIKIDRPDLVQEVRIYFTLGVFTAGNLPGMSVTYNGQSYMKAFRPNDDTSFNAAAATAISAANIVQGHDLTDSALASTGNKTEDRSAVVAERIAAQDQARLASLEVQPGLAQWTEFGVIGIPLRRGDFKRNGSDDTVNWANVKGITCYVMTNAAVIVNASFDYCFLQGGYPIDSVNPGAQPYDWVCTNFDPRTKAESNYGPEMPVKLDVLREKIVVVPPATGDAALRQRFYRRGGTIIDNWYLDGDNGGDGLPFTSVLSDAATFGTGIVAPLDNDQPVTTQDAAGNEVFAAPVGAIFGPISDMLVAVGDAYRPGFMYWSNPGAPDSWSSDNSYEVCGASEILLNGGVYGSQGFVASIERLYAIIPNLQTQGGLTAVPTACAHGIMGRTCFAVGTGGMYLASKDGIYRTTGGDPGTPITDEIRGIFEGDTISGFLPVDKTQPDRIRLAEFNNDLWFGYCDSSGTQRWLIYSLIYRYWRAYDFADAIVEVYSEEGTGLSLVMGGYSSGKGYAFGGTTDNGVAINWLVRSGTLNAGSARTSKRYGQVQVQINQGSAPFTVTGFVDDQLIQYGPFTIPSANGRQPVYKDIFSGAEVTGRNLAIELAGSSSGGTLELWTTAFAYIEEPADYTQWGSDAISHGIPGWKRLIRMMLGYRALADITLLIEAYNQTGVMLSRFTYTIPGTGGQKIAADVPFKPTKGILFRYTFSSTQPFRIYEGEGAVTLVPMNSATELKRPVFGTRDYDPDSPLNPLLAAMRPGGQS